jgi:hypothetical protein
LGQYASTGAYKVGLERQARDTHAYDKTKEKKVCTGEFDYMESHNSSIGLDQVCTLDDVNYVIECATFGIVKMGVFDLSRFKDGHFLYLKSTDCNSVECYHTNM